MPTIVFRPSDTVGSQEVFDRIRTTFLGTIGGVKASNGRIYFIELPTATQVEADAVKADLETAFPRETSVDWIPVIIPLVMPTAALIWTNMPAAVTEFRALTIHRTRFSLAPFKEARLVANVQVIGTATAEIGAQVSDDNGTTWQSLTGVLNSASPFVSISALGTIAGGVVSIAFALRKDVLFRLVGRNGDGLLDPSFGNICLQVR